MRSSRVAGALIAAMVVATAIAADAVGGRSVPPGEIRLVDGDDFALTGEEVISGGAVVDTYSSKTGTIKVIGGRGSSVGIVESIDPATRRRTASVQLSTSRPKTMSDAEAYRRSGRSTVADLVALGMPRDQAVREFGDMDTMNGASARSGADGRWSREVASLSAAPPMHQLAPAVSATTPYDTLCASLSYDGGKIIGYGCSTLYLVAASGGDWWFDNKYKFSAHSSDGSIYRPQRLFEVGWGLSWATNNVVYDWEPESTVNRSDCGSVRFSLFAKGASVSIDGQVCPSRIGPWNLGSAKSGSLWQGVERGQDYEAAIGVQAVHSPPNAAASYDSPFKLVWGPFPP
jgi:hypothetical protein